MGFSISIDWQEEFKKDYDKWINHGKDILMSSCKDYDNEENAKTEFEQQIKDDNDFKEQWADEEGNYTEESFKEWLEEHHESNAEYKGYCEKCGVSNSYRLEEYEGLIELWAWYGSCG